MSQHRLVLLHGLGADHRAFQRFERLLPEEWDVRALDLLGHGDAPKPDQGYSLDAHAEHIAGRLAELWPDTTDNPPVLAGHSYGAATGVGVASRHPQLVRALVLLDPIVRLGSRAGADPLTSSHHPGRERAGVADDHELGSATEQMFRARREGTMAETVERLYSRESPALKRWIVDTWQAMAVGVLDEFDGDWMRFAAHVTCPVTIIHGELERGGGGDLSADWFDEPRVVPITGAGHYLHATHARDVARELVSAVTGAPSAR
jgi:pimeloyl-ACP methyl ester carboxylesterase